MHWDVEDLKHIYKRLNNLHNKEKRPIDKVLLWNDLCTINHMLSLYNENETSEQDCIININYDKKCVDYFKQKYREVVLNLHEYSQIKLKNPRPQNLLIPNYHELIKEFFIGFQPELFQLYDYLRKNNKIELNANKKYSVGYNGECLYNITFDDIYIYSRFNNRIFSSLFLPHEMGHAYQTRCFSNIHDALEKNYSYFVEVYSTYIELLFIDFLKEKGYKSQSVYMERRYWQYFFNMSENQEYYLMNQDYFLMSHYLKYIISMLLSSIFYDDYLKNKNHDMINEFNKNYCNTSDVDILKEYSLNRILNGGYCALKRIL